ncbi:MAG: nucleotidyltransferase family protein, partial [Clostridia bacterium]|nr:nucleotidyltransferase family protein [Clostridia bacterium]
MVTAGIAAEYNPFHSGHAHLIEKARAREGLGATHVVAVMSGHFVQRGAPAV